MVAFASMQQADAWLEVHGMALLELLDGLTDVTDGGFFGEASESAASRLQLQASASVAIAIANVSFDS